MPENTIVVAGKIYRVPAGWTAQQGVPIFEYVGEQPVNQTAGSSSPWLWIGIGAALLFVIGKKR